MAPAHPTVVCTENGQGKVYFQSLHLQIMYSCIKSMRNK